MPVPSSISDLSQTAASNSPPGSESPNTTDDYLRTYAAFIASLRDGAGFTDPVTLASATTTNIGGQSSMFAEITGTTTITGFGTTYNGPRFLRFTGALTLTHNATTLNLPGAANITTAAGDTCIAIPNSTPNGWNVVSYQRAAIVPGGQLIGTQVFSTAGSFTYTPTAGTQSVIVDVVGAGGGSGGCAATGGGQVSVAGGGGSGAYARARLTSSFSGVSVVVGAAGTAGATAGNGGNGGQSSFGTIIAAGGSGSVAGTLQTPPTGQSGGVGGALPTTGNIINAAGIHGDIGTAFSTGIVSGGDGAPSHFGGGARGGSSAVGSAGNAPGAGAGGSSNGTSLAAKAGAAGADGIVVVYEYA